MKVILYSAAFYPSVGGIETVSATLAESFNNSGISVKVVTETPLQKKDADASFPYLVIRQPSIKERFKLISEADLVYSNGASLALFFYAKILSKPFVWTHAGYQLICIDGLGWVDGEAAPMSPFPSILYHYKRHGFGFALKEGIKLFLRRSVGNLVDKNIAITNWVAQRQKLNNQVVIYNPFPLSAFRMANKNAQKEFSFIYVGRLVSEKGIVTLLKAMKYLKRHPEYTHEKLLIVGGGNYRCELEKVATDLDITDNITFIGSKTNSDLLYWIGKAEIAVVPSEWEEPMGGVVVELMAAGKCLIVSANGGHAECAGDAALTFPNGDAESLYRCMLALLEDEPLRQQLKINADKRIALFEEQKLSKAYIELFKEVIHTT